MRLLLGFLLALAFTLGGGGPAAAQPTPNVWQAASGASGDNTYSGAVDAPSNGASVSPFGGPVTVSGWFVDTTAQGWAGADDMQVFVGSMDAGTLLARGKVGIARPDVAASLNNPYWGTSGFSATVDPLALPVGQVMLTVALHTPSKGWWSQQVSVTLNLGAGEILAPAPARQGPPPVLIVDSPKEGEYVRTDNRTYRITGSARDPIQGAKGIDWVELWLNGEANSDQATVLGVANLNAGGTWDLPFDPASHDPINSNLYVYAHSAVNGKQTAVVVHFYITDRR
jgi:hypothetical protein